MTVVCVLVVYLLISPVAAAAEETPRIRALDAWAAESVDRAIARSALTRELVAILETSDVIVHVETRSPMPRGAAGSTQLVTRAGGFRFVRVFLERSLGADVRAAIFAHELQHACEIAQSTASDRAGIEALFRTIGRRLPGPQHTYDTDAAQWVQLVVWHELHNDRRTVERLRSDAWRER